MFLFKQVMIKSAKLEWALNNLDAALQILEDAIKVFGDYAKLHMMKGEIEEQMGKHEEARQTYSQGVSNTYIRLMFM